jgi:uncharacterized cupredoxin-like copper-binding protein
MSRRLLAVLLAAAAFALLGIGSTLAAPAAVHATTVQVAAKDFSFTLSRRTVPHGKVSFVITNRGVATHDFAIAGHTSKTIGPGKSTTLTVSLKPGRYTYRCTVDSHTELGMKGVLRVT